MTRRGDRQLDTNQRKRASDLIRYLMQKGYIDAPIMAPAINATQNWLQREHVLGQRAARQRRRTL